jgi:hypothetical protein
MSKLTHKIQKVELACYDHPIFCPFCGQKAFEPDVESPENLCKHVLFIANDEGFEYRSPRFNRLMNIENVADFDVELGDSGYDGFTDSLCCADSVKFAIYVGPPAFFGAYYGFAPVEV